MPKHLFFDLDGTLTPSRSHMLLEQVPLFEALCSTCDVIVVSGAQESQMRKQLPEKNIRYYMLTQNGNHALTPDGAVLWSERFTRVQKDAAIHFIETVRDEIKLEVSDKDDLVEDRGSQISYSLIGHDEKSELKRAFDPDGSKRREILGRHILGIEKLSDAGIEVTVGGTTCLDMFLKGKNKGYHVNRLIERMHWNKNECLYIGDALAPGMNDESVIGVIPTKPVRNPDETFEYIASLLGK
ncbi:HAD-IIB family hydrolase [Candidatus Kaiserbacteria bacterium]|nr:HAD-IIB family hydrolase [Candidatus Kaiserbacteria bacterium]